MFREMRLKREALEETAVKEILENGTSGVLALPKEYTSYFKSVIAFGKVRIMKDEKEIRSAIEKMADKYHPAGTTEERNAAIDSEWSILGMIGFQIEHISGKQARELIKK